ncbi:hypothetical protein ACU635_41090 [[Actinomadura] parvosata]|uniref:hypothetical protein n=1 Tax=[Actinomadura] parvosata TaxID=1955412 RepID=UPI00406C9CFB
MSSTTGPTSASRRPATSPPGLPERAPAAYERNEGADTAKARQEAAALRETLETRAKALSSLAS